VTTEKTVTLKLKSESGEDKLRVPEELWVQFEKRAKELGIPPDRLLIAALADFIVKEKKGVQYGE